ncbi:acyltransferase family protein [Methylobacterium gossipiicola]|uniref:Peptidoglycan/LPS O-acetylase OafA/YrhL, contains acyltransferase and SGNH-hydrolase domains n=1 Tax=Methylobacterium gossipiicola TaxID=582675 RepID=A0A1I2T5F0_9HYPH|nr:acyltransferase [Methylobacterium gossipiicola]SFG60038.1 Peptidoglycan/LPS O-acetylase OafA/YrhL, contains acyltransferase and SGNH-hydrolase domains [Methylobacterium gossipiicola]
MKLWAIQGLRAFAALLIVIHHGQAEVAALADRAGLAFAPVTGLPWPAGVDVFFVISGFIIVHASAPLYGRAGGRARFLAHRVARLVPLYWLVTTLYLALALAVPALLNGAGAPTPGTVAAAFLFWPVARPDGAVQPLYGLGWTLNCEMFFYAVFALGLGWGRGRAVAWTGAVLAGLVALAWAVPNPPTPLGFWGSPIVLEFALGAGLGLARARGLRLSLAPRLALAAAGLFSLAGAGEPAPPWRPLAYGGPALLLVAAAALGRETEGRGNRITGAVVALGDASYALYLVHPFVLRAGREIVLRLGLVPVLGPWGALALMLVLSVVAALAVARFVEAPLTRAARRVLDPATARAPA